jgi:hypothetical protein
MQTQNTLPENLTYGIQLWQLNCLYWDGHNYRFSRHHRSVDPTMRGRIAVPVNQALKRRFAGPDDLCNALKGPVKGLTPPMPDDLRFLLPRGSSITTVVTRESRSSSSSHVLVLAVVQGEIVSISAAVGAALNLPVEFGAVRVASPRSSAGSSLAHRLAIALYQDASALRQSAIG